MNKGESGDDFFSDGGLFNALRNFDQRLNGPCGGRRVWEGCLPHQHIWRSQPGVESTILSSAVRPATIRGTRAKAKQGCVSELEAGDLLDCIGVITTQITQHRKGVPALLRIKGL